MRRTAGKPICYFHTLLFISHTASCVVSHVSLGHRVTSYSLRCLRSFSTLAVPNKQTLWSKFKVFGVPILVTHIMKFLVTTQVPQIQLEKQNRYAFAAPHFFCIVSHVSLGHRVTSYSLRCLRSFSTLAVPNKQTLWSKFKVFGVPILVTHIMKFLVTTQVPQIQLEKQNRYAFAAPHFFVFPL